MNVFATELAPFFVKINEADPIKIEAADPFHAECQCIIEAMASIPTGGPKPTKPKDVAVTVVKDRKSKALTIRFLDIATVRGPKAFVVSAILNDAVRNLAT